MPCIFTTRPRRLTFWEAIFAAECAPPKVRGALVMQWQMWTAFGIMMGYVADLAFYFVSSPRKHGSLIEREHGRD